MKKQSSGIQALVAVDKPSGLSSHDVVFRVKKALGESRVGHAGTLDPEASGLLILGIGQACRLLGLLSLDTKSYEAEIAFGSETKTDDAAGELRASAQVAAELSRQERAEAILASFLGKQEQVPPQFSAISVGGTRSYARARAGEDFSLAPRQIEVFSADLLEISTRDGQLVWRVRFTVSKGCYIRSLARDIGRRAQSAAHLSSLRRLASGTVSLDAACSLDELLAGGKELIAKAALEPLLCMCLPNYELDEAAFLALCHGRDRQLFFYLKSQQVLAFHQPGAGAKGALAYAQSSDAASLSQKEAEKFCLSYQGRLVGIWSFDGKKLHCYANFPLGIPLKPHKQLIEHAERVKAQALGAQTPKTAKTFGGVQPLKAQVVQAQTAQASAPQALEPAQTSQNTYHSQTQTLRLPKALLEPKQRSGELLSSSMSFFLDGKKFLKRVAKPFELARGSLSQVQKPRLYPKPGWSPSKTALVMGGFDGPHRAHKQLISWAAEKSKGLSLLGVTFDPLPAQILSARSGRASAPGLLAQTEERLAALYSRPELAALLVLPFDHELMQLSYQDFFRHVLWEPFHPQKIFVGANFSCGFRAKGTVEALAQYAQNFHCSVYSHELWNCKEAPISSTRIRSALKAAELDLATRLLGRYFSVEGTVIHGRGQGRIFGFPTANVLINPVFALPACGVYAAYALVENKLYPAAVNVGEAPSFASKSAGEQVKTSQFLEASLLDFDQDLYAQKLKIFFVQQLRNSKKFDDLEQLKAQVKADIESVRAMLEPHSLVELTSHV